MLWAAATLCFCGFLRSGEVTIPTEAAFDEATHLTFSDLAVDEVQAPKVLKVHLKASKTDPFRAGVDVYVGKTGTNLCPVGAMLDYLVVRGPGQSPLFFSDGRPLTRGNFVVRVRQALTEVGVDSAPYSGHSFRIGAATTAAKAHQDVGQVAEQCISVICQNAQGPTSSTDETNDRSYST